MQKALKGQSKILFKIADTPKNQICFLIFAILSLAVMVAIFVFSSQSADVSAALSGEFAGRLERLLNSLKWLLGDAFSIWVRTHIRKIAHFTLYTLLGAFLSAALLNTRIKGIKNKIIFSALIGLFYSVTDEIHQLFIDGRSGEVRDVLIDFSGVITGILVCFAIYKIISFTAKKSKKS